MTASGLRYADFGAVPGSRIHGSIERGKAWMDYEWVLYDMDGKPVQAKTLKGKVLFLNFWRRGARIA